MVHHLARTSCFNRMQPTQDNTQPEGHDIDYCNDLNNPKTKLNAEVLNAVNLIPFIPSLCIGHNNL